MSTTFLQAGQLKGAAGLPLLPMRAVLGFFLQQFSHAERAIGRRRETEADRAGVAVASATALAAALMKVATLTPLWQVEQRDMVALLGQRKMLINGSLHFEAIAKLQLARMTESDIVGAVAAHRVPHPTDTHPPTVERLLTLGVQPEDAAKNLALPAQPSISLVDAPEQMERISILLSRKRWIMWTI